MQMVAKKETVVESAKFSKERLLTATIFLQRKDALGAVIQDGEKLTIEEAQNRLEKFMKGKVK